MIPVLLPDTCAHIRVEDCACGENWYCGKGCGWGAGAHPCTCLRQRMGQPDAVGINYWVTWPR